MLSKSAHACSITAVATEDAILGGKPSPSCNDASVLIATEAGRHLGKGNSLSVPNDASARAFFPSAPLVRAPNAIIGGETRPASQRRLRARPFSPSGLYKGEWSEPAASLPHPPSMEGIKNPVRDIGGSAACRARPGCRAKGARRLPSPTRFNRPAPCSILASPVWPRPPHNSTNRKSLRTTPPFSAPPPSAWLHSRPRLPLPRGTAPQGRVRAGPRTVRSRAARPPPPPSLARDHVGKRDRHSENAAARMRASARRGRPVGRWRPSSRGGGQWAGRGRGPATARPKEKRGRRGQRHVTGEGAAAAAAAAAL